VSAATGSIVPGFHTTKVCHDSTCTTPTPGILNFRPTGATAVVVDDVTGLSGNVWGNELGWITLNPTGEGITFANPTTGLLTGKAWSQVSGWINFAPTGQTTTINPATGVFSGWAWTGGPLGGWIKFNCGSNDTCIKTTWMPNASTGGSTGGNTGGSSGPKPDVCPNIPGHQLSILAGYTVNQMGECVIVTDACPNLLGDQQALPFGFTKDSIGACVADVDYCPNLQGTQRNVPSGYSLSTSGDCISTANDSCPDIRGIQTSTNQCGRNDVCTNIPGTQAKVPLGYERSDSLCFPQALDMCTNIEGNQFFVPEGVIITASGECIIEPEDFCSNLSGYQSGVPYGFSEKDGICLFNDPSSVVSLLPEPQEEIVGFSFIPASLKIPVHNGFLDTVVRTSGLNETDAFKVDLVSSILSGFILALFLYILIKLMHRISS
jgi:hypothetical protein